MLERKIMEKLLKWKSKENKMSLVVRGARQVGKTYIIDKFARENYKNYIYINFIESPKYKEIFDGNLDVETLIKQITITISNAKLVPFETIIFLDEIQECPNALNSLKYFQCNPLSENLHPSQNSVCNGRFRQCRI